MPKAEPNVDIAELRQIRALLLTLIRRIFKKRVIKWIGYKRNCRVTHALLTEQCSRAIAIKQPSRMSCSKLYAFKNGMRV